ncbi:MAG: PD-(D/E)XK nuclease family protein [Nitrospirae bacterium]|nr:PD-(D/E)XK nuclease family protein [Nitrospirota bacterium]
MKGFFVILGRKNKGDIYRTPLVIYRSERGEEFLSKIRFYLPQMLPLVRGEVEAEYYPRKTMYFFNSPCGMCDYGKLCLSGNLEGYYFKERKEYNIPFFSPTEIIKYETCPRQWAFYRSGVRIVTQSASLIVGDILHTAIESYLNQNHDCSEVFVAEWEKYKDIRLDYNKKENYKSLREIGIHLMKKFPLFWDQLKKELSITRYLTEIKTYRRYPDFNLNGKPDILCFTSENKKIVIDWKLASKKYDDNWIQVSDQMLCYFLLAEKENYGSIDKESKAA